MRSLSEVTGDGACLQQVYYLSVRFTRNTLRHNHSTRYVAVDILFELRTKHALTRLYSEASFLCIYVGRVHNLTRAVSCRAQDSDKKQFLQRLRLFYTFIPRVVGIFHIYCKSTAADEWAER